MIVTIFTRARNTAPQSDCMHTRTAVHKGRKSTHHADVEFDFQLYVM